MPTKYLIGLATALVLVTAACGQPGESGSGGAAEQFRILFVGGLSGPTAGPTGDAVAGVRAAANKINEDAGGILDAEIVVEELDSTGDPTQAVSVLQRSIAEDGNPDLVYASISSGEALAMLPLLTRSSILSISNASNATVNDPEKYPYHFGTAPSAVQQLDNLPDILTEAGAKNVTAILAEDAFGEGNLQALDAAFEGSGVALDVERFNPEDLDLSVSFQRAEAANPDAIYTDCLGDICARIFEARARVGATDTPMYVGAGASSGGGPVAIASTEALQKVLMRVDRSQVQIPPEEQSEVYQDFINRLKAGSDELDTSIYPSVLAFDGVRSVAAAAEAAGKTEPAAIRDAMESLQTEPGYHVDYPDGVGYTAASHFPAIGPGQFSYVVPAPLVGGVFQTQAGTSR